MKTTLVVMAAGMGSRFGGAETSRAGNGGRQGDSGFFGVRREKSRIR